ncbi:hypothetical protein ACPV5O_26870 [Vibrio maritimus]|uniref:hypothetical protein n=1 Tax=Vibrio maritimus TaxID=990268 RepID=UPI00406821FC
MYKASKTHKTDARSLKSKAAKRGAQSKAAVLVDNRSMPSAFSASTAPIQAKTAIKHSSKEITWEGAKGIVGVKVDADLDPKDKVTGSAVADSQSYTGIDSLVSKYNAGWARGHLLNHDLGGKGIPQNLYPITSGANRRHANYVEYRVKDALAAANASGVGDKVHYSVEVKGTPSDSQFVCDWQYQSKDGVPKVAYGGVDSEGHVVVSSKLKGRPSKDKEQPNSDPYSNSIAAPVTTHVIWPHGDYKGHDAPQSNRITWEDSAFLPGSLLAKEANPNYSFVSGQMTAEQSAEVERKRLERKRKTYKADCQRAVSRSFVFEVARSVYRELKDRELLPSGGKPETQIKALLRRKFKPVMSALLNDIAVFVDNCDFSQSNEDEEMASLTNSAMVSTLSTQIKSQGFYNTKCNELKQKLPIIAETYLRSSRAKSFRSDASKGLPKKRTRSERQY